MRRLLFLALLLALPAEAGLSPFTDPHILLLKGRWTYGSAFAVQLKWPDPRRQVVFTVPAAFARTEVPIQSGFEIGWLYRLRKFLPKAYIVSRGRPVWEGRGVMALYAAEVWVRCDKCGLEAAPLHGTRARAAGFAGEVAPGKLGQWWHWVRGTVEERASEGNIWREGDRYFGDMDALPGMEGGAILDDQGRAMGVITQVFSPAEGKRTLEFVPLDVVMPLLPKAF